MSETILTALRRPLIKDYHGLKERLGRRFGSADFAGEVLHEVCRFNTCETKLTA